MSKTKTRLVLRPGQKGTTQLTQKYGDSLVCIRYRYDEANQKRLKTVELIVEVTDWKPSSRGFSSETLVPLRIAASNLALRQQVKSAGGKWSPNEKLWYVKYGAIKGGELENHIYIDSQNHGENK